MKTKYYRLFIILGLFVGASGFRYGGIAILIPLFFGTFLMGYGLKLKRLHKKGIEAT